MIEISIVLPVGYYLDYFGYLFPRDPESGAYCVSSTTDIGKLLIAYAKISDKPIQAACGGKSMQTVTLSLPLTSTSQDLRNKWLYYTEADTARLQAVLRTEFNLDFIAYYLRGSAMGHQKKEVIEMFIVSRKLITVDPYEALHKRVYRMEQRKMQEVSRKLIRKANYFEESLNIEGLI